MSLRVIVAITLVAAALSAPTWTKQLNDMKVHELEPEIVRTSSLYTAGSGSNPADGGETANCNCVGCSYHYWDSDRDQARDYTKTQCFDDCVAQAKCKFALHDTAIPLNGNRTSAVHGTDPNKVTHKCWLYEQVPTNFQSTDNKVAAHASGGSHYTCFAKTTSAPVTLDPTSSPNTPQYQYSQLGSNSCPSGCSAINDLQTCKNILSAAQSMNPAASQLGGNTAGSGSGGNYGSGRPGGCFLHNPNKHIHFNTDSTGGNSHGDDYKICKC
jgi:hypothetical protein